MNFKFKYLGKFEFTLETTSVDETEDGQGCFYNVLI
jgi:hypothetical protein